MGFWINLEITISRKESDERFYSHENKPQLEAAWRKTYLENRSSLVVSHIFVGSIPVVTDERVKGYIQESIRLRIVAYATVAATICVKAPDYLKDLFVRAKLQFEGFDNATQQQKPHRESVRPVFALCHGVIKCRDWCRHLVAFHD